MKKFLAGLILAIAAQGVLAQSAVIRGEVSPGVYENISSVSGSLRVSGGAAAATLGDAVTNPSITSFGSFNSVFNGTTWDRARGSANNAGVAKVTILGIDPCQSGEVAKSSAVINITTAGTPQLVALQSSQKIYVCSFSLTISQVVTTANTLTFVYGTGSNCGTGQVALTGSYGAGGVTAAAPIVIMSGYGSTLFATAASNALCATTAIGATGSFQGVLTYVQGSSFF